ncbi:MAG: hypothetical protein ABIW19_10030 [Vicinamibacterales bacterium]
MAFHHDPPASASDREQRLRLLARARVFVDPSDHRDQPGWAAADFPDAADVSCIYVPKAPRGTTLKFDCRTSSGEIVKVKYGRTRERLAEVAATRLLRAMDFGADRVSFVQRLHCYGCPPSPFRARLIAEQFFLTPVLDWLQNNTTVRTYDWVTIERELAGREITAGDVGGWSWPELDEVREGAGGATRGEIDALRLMAVFLAHWDAKPGNQRLICMESRDATDSCRLPLLMLQDVGATFGPGKVQLAAWQRLPMWTDAAACRVSMEQLPYQGAGFGSAQISEEGRRLLATRFRQFSSSDIAALLQSARFAADAPADREEQVISAWTAAFMDKVAQIVDRPPCPSVSGHLGRRPLEAS